MRPKLLKSFLSVTLFWFLATTLYWSFSSPANNLASLAALKSFLPFLPFDVPAQTSILVSWKHQLLVLTYWSLPTLLLTLFSFGIGYGLVWLRAHKSSHQRIARETATGSVRGLTVSIGEMPVLPQIPRDEIELGNDPNGLTGKLSTPERQLLEQILGTLSAHPHAYPGPGNSGSLLDLAMSVTEQALESNNDHPGLAACVASGSELGKITAYVKESGSETWSKVKQEAREGARLMTALPAWWELPETPRQAVMLAVKYKADPRSMPELEGDENVFRMAQSLLYTAKAVEEVVVTEVKKQTLEKHELGDVVFNAFKDAMPLIAFQNRGLPKGVRAVAWKFGKRVYMLEIALRETVTAKMPADVVSALTPTGKKQRLQPFTVELLKALDKAGWLVKEIDGVRINPLEAVWNIQAGKLEFRGVIIIDAPEDLMNSLPPQDSMYEVKVNGPMFAGVAREESAGLDKPNKGALAGVLDM